MTPVFELLCQICKNNAHAILNTLPSTITSLFTTAADKSRRQVNLLF